MPLKIHNTLSKETELFEPLNPPKVNMYVCGITPYDSPHLGHARAYITFDVVRRYLEHLKYQVNYVQNITDIDDKIIKKANEEGKPISEISEKYTQEYKDMMGLLNVKPPTMYPKATEHIPDMIKTIANLIAKGYAYEVSGDVYYEVAKFKDYGKLSHRTGEAMMAGARVAIDERKKSPLDFALWKACKPEEPSWDSPWGKGRPGWHIECSAMSAKYLGETFDIHGGGLDLVFPHHENEIAQAEAATGKQFVKYWIHNGFVTVNKEKMSKSLKNFFTIKEVLGKFDPRVIRLFLLSTHYRSPVNYSDDDIKAVENKYLTLKQGIDDIHLYIRSEIAVKDKTDYAKNVASFRDKFNTAMNNDLNTAEAIGVIFETIAFAHGLMKRRVGKENLKAVGDLINDFGTVLGLELKESNIPEQIRQIDKERMKAKQEKNYALADQKRKLAEEIGFILRDTPFGTAITASPSQASHLGAFRKAGAGKLSTSKDDNTRAQ